MLPLSLLAYCATIILSFPTPQVLAFPLQSDSNPEIQCHCLSYPGTEQPFSIPLSKSHSKSRRKDPCSNLGPKLERWQSENPLRYQAYLRNGHSSSLDSLEEPTPSTFHDLRPLPTSILLDISVNFATPKEARSISPEPHVYISRIRPGERVVCNRMTETADPQQNYEGSGSYGVVLVLLCLIVLACVAEVVEFAMHWIYIVKRRRTIKLLGKERDLKAYHETEKECQPAAETSQRLVREDDDEDDFWSTPRS